MGFDSDIRSAVRQTPGMVEDGQQTLSCIETMFSVDDWGFFDDHEEEDY